MILSRLIEWPHNVIKIDKHIESCPLTIWKTKHRQKKKDSSFYYAASRSSSNSISNDSKPTFIKMFYENLFFWFFFFFILLMYFPPFFIYFENLQFIVLMAGDDHLMSVWLMLGILRFFMIFFFSLIFCDLLLYKYNV